MRSRSRTLAAVLLLAATFLTTVTARAADDEYKDDYEENARVMRISLLRGEVSLRRTGSQDWERARLNAPLVEGDTLTTGRDAHVEIQIDARNFVRVGQDSALTIVTLRDEGIALSLSEGTATVRLAQFDGEREYFEVDAPKSTLAAEKRGLYRLDVGRDGRVRFTARDGGRARIYSETSGFTLRENRTAELVYDGTDEGDWELNRAASFDDWDTWNDDRERYLASRLRYEGRERYYDREVWGAEELDAYGDWSYVSSYGWVWRPHVTVINNYHDWAPYRYGHWTWCPPYGWTWVADEPWGWAPYHYGRWVYYNNYWCWAPRGYGYHYGRAWWRPALVAFIYLPTSYGEHVAWYPLGYGHRDPRGRNFRRLTPLRANEAANLRRTNPAFLRAVTTLPAREFGAGATRARPATDELARRAIEGEPVRGRLPIAPNGTRRNGETGTEGRGRLSIARPPSSDPARTLPARPTGAATRTPGVALDGELRRARVFKNREPRLGLPTDADERTGRRTGDTGAVERPSRPGVVRPPLERRGDAVGDDDDNRDQPVARPSRTGRPDGLEIRRPAPDADGQPPVRVRRPPAETDGDSTTPSTDKPRTRSAPDERPDPPVYNRPEPTERSRPREDDRPRPVPEERTQPSRPPREEPPPTRREDPPPRYDPPPTRSEPPPERSEPPARSEPPPQRQEPQQREQPPPRSSEPSRDRDSPRSARPPRD